MAGNPTRSDVNHIEIHLEQAGQRIDNFLVSQLKGVPRSYIYRILRTGQVRVNKGRVKPAYRIQVGDRLRIPPLRLPVAKAVYVPAHAMRQVETAILHEDEDVMVFNKPAGLAVHGGSGLQYGIIEVLRQVRPDSRLLELAHRLDRDTSGCLLIAKSRYALTNLHALLREARIQKRYIALLGGCWKGKEHTISTALGRHPQKGVSQETAVPGRHRPAETTFRPTRVFEDCTLVNVSIRTGRMHQIRVHAAQSGHPVAGDEKYGDYQFNKMMRKRGLRRLFLHASRLSFQMPGCARGYDIEAPLDPVLEQVLKDLNPRIASGSGISGEG